MISYELMKQRKIQVLKIIQGMLKMNGYKVEKRYDNYSVCYLYIKEANQTALRKEIKSFGLDCFYIITSDYPYCELFVIRHFKDEILRRNDMPKDFASSKVITPDDRNRILAFHRKNSFCIQKTSGFERYYRKGWYCTVYKSKYVVE